MAKRGRPRKAGPRTPSGRLKLQTDAGTEAAQSRRAYMAGRADPKYASYPLGVMFANGDISEHLREAGTHYAFLYRVVYGTESVGASNYGDSRGWTANPLSDDARAAIEARLQEASDALAKQGRGVEHATRNICVFERFPRWMRPVVPRPVDVVTARAILDGLAVLDAVLNRRAPRTT